MDKEQKTLRVKTDLKDLFILERKRKRQRFQID